MRDGKLSSDLAPDEQRELNVEDRVRQLGQRLRAVLEHVRGDELGDRADRGAERVRRNLGDLGDVVSRATVNVSELRREPVLHRCAPVQRRGARAEHLYQEGLGELGARGKRLEVGVDRGAVRRQPIGRQRVERIVDRGQQLIDGGVVGGEEALVLVPELLVERLARDPGTLDHVRDRHPGVSLLGDRPHHRREHAHSLRLADYRPRRGVAPTRQYREDAGVRLRRGAHGNKSAH